MTTTSVMHGLLSICVCISEHQADLWTGSDIRGSTWASVGVIGLLLLHQISGIRSAQNLMRTFNWTKSSRLLEKVRKSDEEVEKWSCVVTADWGIPTGDQQCCLNFTISKIPQFSYFSTGHVESNFSRGSLEIVK